MPSPLPVSGLLLAASQEKRREHYRVDYLSLEKVSVWTATGISFMLVLGQHDPTLQQH